MILDAAPRRRRRPSLTPMIDVVFLLLVFFMLASRFGMGAVMPLPLAGGGSGYSGPPRIVDILPEGLRLNGSPVDETALAAALSDLTDSPRDTIVLRGRDQADLQRVVDVATLLRGAGFQTLVMIE